MLIISVIIELDDSLLFGWNGSVNLEFNVLLRMADDWRAFVNALKYKRYDLISLDSDEIAEWYAETFWDSLLNKLGKSSFSLDNLHFIGGIGTNVKEGCICFGFVVLK